MPFLTMGGIEMIVQSKKRGNRMKARIHAIGAVVLALCLPGMLSQPVDARSLEEARKSGKVIVGVSGDNPPFGFVDTSGRQNGYDADIAAAFAKSLGLDVQYTQLSLAARIPSLLSRKVDILVAGLGITEERAKSIQFSAPYLETRMYVMSRKDARIGAPADLSGLAVGTPRSSTLDTLLTAIAPKDTDIRRFDDDSATIQSLLSGQVDAIAANQFAIQRLEELKPAHYENKIQIGSVWYGAGTRQGEKDWNEAFNEFFEKFRTTDEFKAIYNKWLKNDVPQFPAELAGISFTVP